MRNEVWFIEVINTVTTKTQLFDPPVIKFKLVEYISKSKAHEYGLFDTLAALLVFAKEHDIKVKQ